MKIFKIPKKNGKFRTIYAPSAEEKAEMRALLPALENTLQLNDFYQVQHGFRESRSPVTNASCHRGFEYTLCFDIADFFDNVKRGMDEYEHDDVCFVDGIARQGLPTSPALSNLAFCDADKEIMKLVSEIRKPRQRFGRRTLVYTRYADDLTFSFDDGWTALTLMREIPGICDRSGFPINPSKTHLQWSGAGRRMITGVSVDGDLKPSREVKRRLRSAKHALDTGHIGKRTVAMLAREQSQSERDGEPSLRTILRQKYEGLMEWSRLKIPKGYVPSKPTFPGYADASMFGSIGTDPVKSEKIMPSIRRFDFSE